MSEVDNLKLLLKWFDLLSGLQINLGKCELIGVQSSESQVNSFARSFGCNVGKLLAMYLRMPLCVALPRKYLWDSVVDSVVDKKLSS